MATAATPRTARARSTARPNSVPKQTELAIPQELIAQRAFEKFLARGCQHGFDQQDWFDAEDELIAESREQ